MFDKMFLASRGLRVVSAPALGKELAVLRSKKKTEAPFSMRVPNVIQDVFLIEKDAKKFPNTRGWAYAGFDYDLASDTFKPDPTGVVSCGFTCHSSVAAKDYIFTAYGKR